MAAGLLAGRRRTQQTSPELQGTMLGALAGQRTGRDAFWIFFAAYLVMLTPGRTRKARRSSSRQRDLRRFCSPSRPSSFRTGRSSRSDRPSSLPGSGSVRPTPCSAAASRRSAPSCGRRRAHRRDRRLGAACSTRPSAARSHWSRHTCSGRGTTGPTSRSPSRPSRHAADCSADGTRDIDRPCRRSRACRRARCCPSAERR